jgi:hypothetical protein
VEVVPSGSAVMLLFAVLMSHFLSSRTRVNEHGESDKDGVRPWSRRLVGDKLDGALRIIGVGVFIGGWDKSLSACPTSTR